jgi:hypothetical protein
MGTLKYHLPSAAVEYRRCSKELMGSAPLAGLRPRELSIILFTVIISTDYEEPGFSDLSYSELSVGSLSVAGGGGRGVGEERVGGARCRRLARHAELRLAAVALGAGEGFTLAQLGLGRGVQRRRQRRSIGGSEGILLFRRNNFTSQPAFHRSFIWQTNRWPNFTSHFPYLATFL